MHWLLPGVSREPRSGLVDFDGGLLEILFLRHRAGHVQADLVDEHALVEERGELAVRGGILDIFPPHRAHPIQIELLGDEVESIREFDAASQRSQGRLSHVVAAPPRELLVERDVVIEERRMRTEDKPSALTYEQFMATAFQVNPYHNPVIGWMDDLKSLPLDDLSKWYKTWYSPNNATLAVVGAVEPEAVRELAQQPGPQQQVQEPLALAQEQEQGLGPAREARGGFGAPSRGHAPASRA